MVDIDLASFSFDTSDIVKGAAEIKKSIDSIKKEQAQLRKDNDTSSEAFVSNTAALKTLNSMYGEHIKYLSNSSKASLEASTREAQLDMVLSQEAVTIKELRDQNKELNKLRNDANLLTEEGQIELQILNNQLDQNNALIKENVDQYTQQKIGIGDYQTAIENALSGVKIFGIGLNDVKNTLTNVQSGFVLVKNSVVDATKTMSDATKASKGMDAANKASFLSTQLLSSGLKVLKVALISTGIGAIVVAFGSLIAYLSTTQAGMDAITAVTRPLTAVFQTLLGLFQNLGKQVFDDPLGALKSIYEFVKKQLIESFTGLGKIIEGVFTFDGDKIKEGADQIKKIADDNAAALKEFANGIGDQMALAYEKGLELDKLTKELERTQIRNTTEIGIASEAFKAQNKIAEDTNKTLSEREEAVQQSIIEAGKINALKQQELDLEIEILKNKQSYNDTSREEELALAELIARKNELNATELEQTTTQQNKLNTIRREAESKANAASEKALDDRLKTQQEKIDLYEQENLDQRARTLQQELDIDRDIATMRLALLNEQLRAQKISQEQYARDVIAIQQDLAQQEAQIAVNTASRELEAYKQGFEKQMAERLFLSDEVLANKTNELNNLLLKESEFAATQLEQGLINQQEYDDAIFLLQEENRLAIKEITDEREATEKQEAAELRALDFENELALLTEENASRFELENAQIQENYRVQQEALEDALANQQISEELFNAKLKSINNAKSKAELSNEKILAEEKLSLATGLFEAASSIIDENSKVGKSIALAQAGINMFEGVSAGVKLGYPAAIPAVASALTVGGGAISNILSTDIPSASGTGTVSSGGNTGFSADFTSNLSGQSVSLDPSSDVNIQDSINDSLNLSGMAESIADAVQTGAQLGTQIGSQEGITNLSANNNIAQGSGF